MVYTDGALKGLFPCARCAGWALIVIHAKSATWDSYGTLVERYPTVFRAEIRAVLEALRLAVPPLTLHTDNGLVVLGWQRGKQWCCSSERDGADFWQVFWRRKDDIGNLKTFKRESCRRLIGVAMAWPTLGPRQVARRPLPIHPRHTTTPK